MSGHATKLKMVENFVRQVLSEDLNQKHVSNTKVKNVAMKVSRAIPTTVVGKKTTSRAS